MIEEIKKHIITLNEEIDYRENILKHKKSLEATLWGLEEQIKFPENQAPLDQEEIKNQINACQIKIVNCNKLLDKHSKKLMDIFQSFKLNK
jgi:hypothetical protein